MRQDDERGFVISAPYCSVFGTGCPTRPGAAFVDEDVSGRGGRQGLPVVTEAGALRSVRRPQSRPSRPPRWPSRGSSRRRTVAVPRPAALSERCKKRKKNGPLGEIVVLQFVPDRHPPAATRIEHGPLVREVVRPRWTFRLGPPSLDGLTRRRGAGLGGCCTWTARRSWWRVSGTVSRRGAASEEAARAGIARMRLAIGHRRRPRRLPRALPRRPRDRPRGPRAPGPRVRRNPDPVGGAHVGDHRAADRHAARGGHPAPHDLARSGAARGGLRDSPSARGVAGLAPAELEACGLRAEARPRAAPCRARGRARGGDAAGAARRRTGAPRPSRADSPARDPRDRDVDGRDARRCTGSGASTSCPRATSAISSSSGG